MTANLRTLNFQYAVLKRIADTVKEGMETIKQNHLDALLADAENSGGTQWAVDLDGQKVATVSLAGGKVKPKVERPSELIAWALEHRPDLVDTEPRLTPQAARTIEAMVETFTDDGEAVTADGEVLPGVGRTVGSVYQSVRFAATKDVNGKAAVDRWVTEAGVAGLIEDAVNGGDR